jgi:hypothetical protein
MDSSDTEQSLLAGFCKLGNEPSDLIISWNLLAAHYI